MELADRWILLESLKQGSYQLQCVQFSSFFPCHFVMCGVNMWTANTLNIIILFHYSQLHTLVTSGNYVICRPGDNI